MDDFIYILALIAWVIFAFYRNSQKKAEKARQAQRQKPRPEQMPLPTLEEIILGREPVYEPEPEPLPEAVTVMSDGTSPVLRETAFEREYNLRGITSIEEMDKPFKAEASNAAPAPKDAVEETMPAWREGLREFNARQAVIYAEILNRPYA
jgi:hypothetical protein